MSNAKTGIWSAIGAVLGGAAGAAAGNYVAQMRPRVRYANASRKRSRGQHIEDAMVMGGAAGATVGAFLGGTIAGEETPPLQLRK
jgi:alcohol dehydrogenase class IV